MAKRDENVLGLGPLAPDLSASSSASLFPWSSRRALSFDQQGVIDENEKQTLAISAIAAKTLYGETRVCEIHQHTATTFDEAVGFIVQIKDQPERTKEYQAFVDEFCRRQIQLLAQHLLGVLEVSATGIGMEINRSPYPEPQPRSFWKRWFG